MFTNIDVATRPPEGHSTIILLDGINGWFDNFALARQSVLGLLPKLPADEKVAIYVLVKGVGMVTLQDYTTDRARLAAAISKVIPRALPAAPPHMPEEFEGMTEQPATAFQQRLGGGSPSPARVEPWHTSAAEKELALRIASEDVRESLNGLAEKLKSLPGRKSIFWVTQGFPPSQIRAQSDVWDKTFKSLNDANIAVNTVDSNGLGGPPRYWGPGAILALQEVAQKTGGEAFYHRNDLDTAIVAAVEDARRSYTLGFYLTDMDGKYHELKARVDRPDVQITHRRGYYAQSETVPSALARKMTLQSALLNPSGSTDVRITATIETTPGTSVSAHLKLDPEPLSVRKTAAGYTVKIEELFLEVNADGRQVGQFSDAKEFRIGASEKNRFDKYGVVLSKTVPLVRGTEKLLIVVRDTASGRVGSVVVPLRQVPPSPSGDRVN